MDRAVEDRRFLAGFASAPGVRVGLTRAAVLLARTECPDADPDRVEAELDVLSRALREQGKGARTPAERAEALADLLGKARGLAGDVETYDDPRNSCPECVLDRGLGIPLTLSILWMGVGRRTGWQVDGVGFPGHFLVRVSGADGGTVLADPFRGGRVLGLDDARDLLEAMRGRPLTLRPEHVRSLEPRAILMRMLRNLRGCYTSRGDRARALRVADDMLILSPGLPEALHDRGMLRLATGNRGGAVRDLREFVNGEPESVPAVRALRLLLSLTNNPEMLN
ncbi:MAG: SirB1 family protein [Planctomycetota bacterium]